MDNLFSSAFKNFRQKASNLFDRFDGDNEFVSPQPKIKVASKPQTYNTPAPKVSPIKVQSQNNYTKLKPIKLGDNNPFKTIGQELRVGAKQTIADTQTGIGAILGQVADLDKNIKTNVYKKLNQTPLKDRELPNITGAQKISQNVTQAGRAKQSIAAQDYANLPEIEDKGFKQNIRNPAYVRRILATQAPSFATNLGIGAALTAITRNPAVGGTFISVTGAAQGVGSIYNEALSSGASEGEARAVADIYGVASGALEAWGVGKLLKRIPGGEKVKGKIMQEFVKDLTEEAIQEGSTEAAQQILGNAIAKVSYDEGRNIWEGVPESAFAGTILGGVGSATVSTGKALIPQNNVTINGVDSVDKGTAFNTIGDDIEQEINSKLNTPQSEGWINDIKIQQNEDGTLSLVRESYNRLNGGINTFSAPLDTVYTTVSVDEMYDFLESGRLSADKAFRFNDPSLTMSDDQGFVLAVDVRDLTVGLEDDGETVKVLDDIPARNVFEVNNKPLDPTNAFAREEDIQRVDPKGTDEMVDQEPLTTNQQVTFEGETRDIGTTGLSNENLDTATEQVTTEADVQEGSPSIPELPTTRSRMTYYGKSYALDFQDPTEKAYFFVGDSKTKTKNYKTYLNYLKATTGQTEEQIIKKGKEVVKKVKKSLRGRTAGNITIPGNLKKPAFETDRSTGITLENGVQDATPGEPSDIPNADMNKPIEESNVVPVEEAPYKVNKALETAKNKGLFDSEEFKEITADQKNWHGTQTNDETLRVARSQIDTEEKYEAEIEKILAGEDIPLSEGAVYVAKVLDLAYWESKKGNTERSRQIREAGAKKAVEMGRAVQAWAIISRYTPQGMLQYADKLLKQAQDEYQKTYIYKALKRTPGVNPDKVLLVGKDKEFKLSPESEQAILSLMEEVQGMEDGPEKYKRTQQAFEIISEQIPLGLGELFTAYRYNNMLSNPRSQLRNVWGNFFQGAINRPLTGATALPIDWALSGLRGKERTVYLNEVTAYPKGLMQALPEATKNAWNTVTGKASPETRPDFRDVRMKKLPMAVKWASVALEASDQFYKTLITEAIVAEKLANDSNRSMQDIREEAIAEADRLLFREETDAKNETDQGIFSAKFDQMTDALTQFRDKIPGGSWVIPFIRTIMSMAKQTGEYSPGGLANAVTIEDRKARHTAYAKATMGSMVMITGFMAASAGKTTWKPPTDPDEKELFYETRKPYSISINIPGVGEKWVPFQYFGVYGLALAIPAAIQYYNKESNTALTDSQMEKVGKILLASINYYASSTPMQGFEDYMKLITGQEDTTMGTSLSFTAGQTIYGTGLLAYVTQLIDPVFRDARGKNFQEDFVNGLKRNLPFLSMDLESYNTVSGQPSTRNITDYIMPYSMGDANSPFEEMYWEEIGKNQRKNKLNSYKKQIKDKVADMVKGIKSGSTGEYGSDYAIANRQINKEVLDAVKDEVNDYLELYQQVSDPEVRAEIKQTIEGYGVSFNSAIQNYMSQEFEANYTGTSPEVIAKQERGNEFQYMRKLRNEYANWGLGQDFLSQEYSRLGISPQQLAYDDKTALPDDLQYEEINYMIEGKTGVELMDTLAQMKIVSEGTRKALLTDSMIGKLEDDGIITETVADLLKRLKWDADTGTFGMLPEKAKKGKSAPRINPPKIKTPELNLNTGLGGSVIDNSEAFVSSLRPQGQPSISPVRVSNQLGPNSLYVRQPQGVKFARQQFPQMPLTIDQLGR